MFFSQSAVSIYFVEFYVSVVSHKICSSFAGKDTTTNDAVQGTVQGTVQSCLCTPNTPALPPSEGENNVRDFSSNNIIGLNLSHFRARIGKAEGKRAHKKFAAQT